MARSAWRTLGVAVFGALLCAAVCTGRGITTNAGSKTELRRRNLLQATADPGGQCGPSVNARCGDGECCSQYGWCGDTSEHCGDGCQPDWGSCSDGGNVPPPPPSNPSSPGNNGGSIISGISSATYYYDIRDLTCPNEGPYPENDGVPACASYTPGPDQQTLRQLGSDNVVAIDRDLLGANREGLCGKKVIITYKGQQVAAPDGGDFFVWDGCEACVGGGRIDFSLSGAQNINGDACNLGVIPDVTYNVVDEQVKTFVP